MARKNIIKPYKIFDLVQIDQNQISQSTDINYLDNVGIVISWTGTSPLGEILIECANPSENVSNETLWSWVSLDFGSQISISGDSGSHIINMTQNPFSKLRLNYLRTSGTGTLSASLTAKQVGG